MPTYEYICQACGHALEEFQKISEAPIKKCPKCGKNKLQKQVSPSAFHLKGGGWYVTDFREKAKNKVADEKSETASDTDKKDQSKDNTKSKADKADKESGKASSDVGTHAET